MHVFLIAAVTQDGFIARNETDRSFDWTSPEDKQFYIDKIKSADAIIIGSKTFTTFSRHPKNSTWVIVTRKPELFINNKPDVITTLPTDKSPKEIVDMLKKQGKQNVVVAGGQTIYTLFMDAQLVDTVYLTQETNTTFNTGISLFSHPIDLGRPTKTTPLSSTTILNEYHL